MADAPTPEQVMNLFVRALRSRELADQGIYCECEEPDAPGLMCQRCDRRNRAAEVAAVHRIADAHDFKPRHGYQPICEHCTMTEDDPRHHGVPAKGRTSWGEMIQGGAPDA